MIFKQVFRVAFVALIWKQYKAGIISSLLLVAYLFIVGSIHKDYLTAVGSADIDRLSFVYKWGAYVVGIVIFILFHLLRGRLSPREQSTKEKIAEAKDLTDTEEDPFAAIRERKKLRSQADFLIDDKKKD